MGGARHRVSSVERRGVGGAVGLAGLSVERSRVGGAIGLAGLSVERCGVSGAIGLTRLSFKKGVDRVIGVAGLGLKWLKRRKR